MLEALSLEERDELRARLEYREQYKAASDEERRKLQVRLSYQNDLAAFMRQAWGILQPGRRLIWSWHYDLICEYLTLVKQRKLLRLIINVPPRTMKSIQCSVCFPAWMWTADASHSFVCASYSSGLSVEHSVYRRKIVQSAWYQGLWGDSVSLADDQNQKAQFQNTNSGQMIATSVGGTVLGKGGDTLILDDSMNPDIVASEVERKGTQRWFDETWRGRMNDLAESAMIVIEQRLHEEDLTGYLLKTEANAWKHIRIPLVAEHDEEWIFPISGRVVERKTGEILQPERHPFSEVEGLKLRPRIFAGQQQQRPSPAEGNIFKREWWQFYKELPDQLDLVIESWDCAFKETKDSDFVVGQVWGRKGARYYLIDQVRGRMDFVATKHAIKSLTAKWQARGLNPSHKLVEDKANGPAVISELKHEVDGLIAVNPEGGKESRAHACSGLVEAGNVYLPDPSIAPWIHDFIEEYSAFPNAANDDQVDGGTQALLRLRVHSYGVIEYLKREQEKLDSAKELAKPVIAEESTKCPKCESIALGKIGSQLRCNSCGHQWGNVQVQKVMTRKDLMKA